MNLGTNYAFKKALAGEQSSHVATAKGIGLKSVLMLSFTFVSAILVMLNLVDIVTFLGGRTIVFYIGIFILDAILQFIICIFPSTTKVLSIPYAICEGVLIGCLVGILELIIPGDGIALAGLALIITVGIFLGASILYSTGVIKVGHKFRSFMLTILVGICICSIVISIVGIFAPDFVNAVFYSSNSTIGLIISIILVIVASIYTIISLDNANNVVKAGVDKKYEWYAAFGIVINIIWLFLEIFRLLITLYDRKNS